MPPRRAPRRRQSTLRRWWESVEPRVRREVGATRQRFLTGDQRAGCLLWSGLRQWVAAALGSSRGVACCQLRAESDNSRVARRVSGERGSEPLHPQDLPEGGPTAISAAITPPQPSHNLATTSWQPRGNIVATQWQSRSRPGATASQSGAHSARLFLRGVGGEDERGCGGGLATLHQLEGVEPLLRRLPGRVGARVRVRAAAVSGGVVRGGGERRGRRGAPCGERWGAARASVPGRHGLT